MRPRAAPATDGYPRVTLVAPLPHPPFKGGVEKGVDLLLRTRLARSTGMRLFNTYHRHDPNRSRGEKLRFQARMVRSFWEDLGCHAADLVHVKTSSGINFYQNSLYCLEARLRRLPVLLQIHSGRFEAFYRTSTPPLQAWIRRTLHSVDRVVVLSEFWRERIKDIAPGARLHVIPNGLSEGELEDLRTGPGTRRTQIFFLGTGNRELNRDKGLDELLAVLPRLARRHPTARWVIAGLEDPEESRRRLRARWDASGASTDNVRCLGTIDTERKIGLLRESTILALPSHFENMPNLLLEGMAAGMAVVATRVGAIPEMLDSSRGGIVIGPGDREALADGLDRLLGDPFLVWRQGRHNEARVASRYTMSVVEDLLEDLYRAVARDRRAVRRPARRPRAFEGVAEALVPLPAVVAADALLDGGGASGTGPVRRTARSMARGALRLSAGLLRPGTWTVGYPRRARADSQPLADSYVPDTISYPRPHDRDADPTFFSPGSPLAPPTATEPGSVVFRSDCPAPRKRIN